MQTNTTNTLRALLIGISFFLLLGGCSDREIATRDVEEVDHGLLDTVLHACVTDQGTVNYDLLRREYAVPLQQYLDFLARINPDSLPRRRQQLAFWINAYNALCLQQVLDVNATHNVFFESSGFLNRRDYFLAGRKRSLNEIQNRILRSEFKDPRIFAALYLPTNTSPPLHAEAYQSEVVNYQLDHQCRVWIARNDLNRFDADRKSLYLSAVFKDYAQDFDRLYDNPRGFYLKFTSDPSEQQYLQAHPDTPVYYLPYDYSLKN
jgi:hypothetical protein